jgi:hypothetical protein
MGVLSYADVRFIAIEVVFSGSLGWNRTFLHHAWNQKPDMVGIVPHGVVCCDLCLLLTKHIQLSYQRFVPTCGTPCRKC